MLSFLMRTREKIARFMYGRYGIDRLVWTLFFVGVFFLFLARLPFPFAARVVFWVLSAAADVMMLCRITSRNTVRRYAEGQKFDAFTDGIVSFFRQRAERLRNRKTHVYRRCPSCKSTLRFRRVKGKHDAICPRCGKAFTVKVRF